jgi:hypothetical protein
MVNFEDKELDKLYHSLKPWYRRKFYGIGYDDFNDIYQEAFIKAFAIVKLNFDASKSSRATYTNLVLNARFIDELRKYSKYVSKFVEGDEHFDPEPPNIGNLSEEIEKLEGKFGNIGSLLKELDENQKEGGFQKLQLRRSSWTHKEQMTNEVLYGFLNKQNEPNDTTTFNVPFPIVRIQAWLACSTFFDQIHNG